MNKDIKNIHVILTIQITSILILGTSLILQAIEINRLGNLQKLHMEYNEGNTLMWDGQLLTNDMFIECVGHIGD